MRRSILLSAALLLAFAASSAFATTYYVSTSGNDGWDGSSGSPWRTIQYAVTHIANGDTIIVRAGTYVGARIETSGTSSLPRTLKVDTGATVNLTSPSGSAAHNGILELENYSGTVSYWVIDGFIVDGQSKVYRTIDTRGTNHVTIKNCTTRQCYRTGIFNAFCDYILVENNTSYSNGEHGIYCNNSPDYGTIRRNTVYSNTGCGIHMNGDASMGGDGIMSYWTVDRNTSYSNPSGSAINMDGVWSSSFFNNLCYNNTGSGMSLYAIDGTNGSSNNKVYNNTIVMPSGGRWCINIPSGSGSNPTGNKIKNNILYNASSSKGSIVTYSTSISGFESDYNVVIDRFSANEESSLISLATWRTYGWDTHSIISTPTALFVNPGSNDYHLLSTSPARNAGTTLTDVTIDKDGNSRPQGSAYDIGCYEYVEGGVPDLVITTTSLPGGTVGVAYSRTVSATGGVTPYSWSISGGSLPAGLSINSSSGVISGTPTTAQTSNFTVRVQDSQGTPDSDTQALSITISAGIQDLVITTTSLPGGTVGTAYSQTVVATGGVTPYSWSVYSGSLPAGLSLGSSTGTISGTPTTAGTSNFTVRVQDSQGTPDSDTQALSIVISAGGTGATYQFTAADTESSTTSTSWQTKATLTFTPSTADDWVILGFAEQKDSSASYSAKVRMTVDGVAAGEDTNEAKDTTDYLPFTALKYQNLTAASHTILIQYCSENSGATAYIRRARVVAIRKASLDIRSTASDTNTALTTTLVNRATLTWTPATAGDYLIIYSAEISARQDYSTQIQAKFQSTAYDDSWIESMDNTDYFTWMNFSLFSAGTSAVTANIAAAAETGTTGTHYIRKARIVAIRVNDGRFSDHVDKAADTETTTTSTSFVEKATKSWTWGPNGNWLILVSGRVGGTSESYSTEARTQINNSITSSQQLREPNDATDWLHFGSIDVSNLTTTRQVDVDYRTENAAATAKIKYVRFYGLSLDD